MDHGLYGNEGFLGNEGLHGNQRHQIMSLENVLFLHLFHMENVLIV